MTAAKWRHVRTERLWLDVAEQLDIDDLYAIHAHPDVWLHFPSGQHTQRSQAAEMVEVGLERWAEDGLGFWSIWTASRTKRREQQSCPIVRCPARRDPM